MSITTTPVRAVPPSIYRQGATRSVCSDLVDRLKRTKTGKMKVTSQAADSAARAEEMSKLYRTFVVWKSRHKDEAVNVRKIGDEVYIWLTEDDQPPV